MGTVQNLVFPEKSLSSYNRCSCAEGQKVEKKSRGPLTRRSLKNKDSVSNHFQAKKRGKKMSSGEFYDKSRQLKRPKQDRDHGWSFSLMDHVPHHSLFFLLSCFLPWNLKCKRKKKSHSGEECTDRQMRDACELMGPCL